MKIFSSFAGARRGLSESLRTHSYLVKGDRWQGVDISRKPEMQMRELFAESFKLSLERTEDLDWWRADIGPNLPFADVHFEERVGGHPTNPGEAYKIWPWGHNAEAFRTQGGKFDHTYQERFWPKYVNVKGTAEADYNPLKDVMRGIRFAYGDLNDLVNHLAGDPLSRQAYLPIWFPEDGTCTGRKPCSLGYHFLMRHDYLHLTYGIRSCDFVRHFQDDCYLAVRLLLWVLDRLREKDDRWKTVQPGAYVMHIASLHMFRGDHERLFGVQASV